MSLPENELDWQRIWTGVAVRLREHHREGRGGLLTEDTVRMSTILELQAAGVDPTRMGLEVSTPALGSGKLDLAIDGPTGVVVELKYPRDSRTGSSPDTMTMGELVRDFLRVAAVPATDRWVVQVLNDRLTGYLRNLSARHDLHWATATGEDLVLGRDVLDGLPATAVGAIGKAEWLLPVRASCVLSEQVGVGLTLYAYRVAQPDSKSAPAALSGRPSESRLSPPPRGQPSPGGARGARGEILAAIRRLNTRSGSSVVTVNDVVTELRRSGSTYAESTVGTMMSSHMCVEAQGVGIGTYDDLERVGRGQYRLRKRHESP